MKIVFIQGPTASGKSQWALSLAQKFHGSIINCDSVQAYADLKIGSAAPTFEEQKIVPHFLYQYVNYPLELTVGDYYRDFFSTLAQVKTQNVFVVGGTGFYFQALEKGLYPVLKVPEEIKQKLILEISQNGGREKLYQELQQNDPETARAVHENDTYRVLRSLEVFRAFGKPFSSFKKEFESQKKDFPYPLYKMGLQWTREDLKKRIHQRTLNMVQGGLIEETNELLQKYSASWSPLQSVGYKEVIDFLEQRLAREELEGAISLATTQLSKRQMTWFQRDQSLNWFEASTGYSLACKSIEEFLNQ